MDATQSTACLRQVQTEHLQGRRPLRYSLHAGKRVIIGRETDCHLCLSSTQYSTVSRYHAELRSRLVPSEVPGQPDRLLWQLQDLDTANGTYVNDVPVADWQILHHGDRIRFSRSGPEFIFEQQPVPDPANHVTLTQLVPLLSQPTRRDLLDKAYLLPGIITVIFVVVLFATVEQPTVFKLAVAFYITSAAYYVIYRLCGKTKPVIVPIATAVTMVLLLMSPLLPGFMIIFRDILPGKVPDTAQTLSFPVLLVRMFFGAGLMEELLKALPLGIAFWIGTKVSSSRRNAIGIQEPLDGIILGTASAAGFILYETLGQYVPMVVQQVGEQQGLQILIPRVLGSVAGHMAYSGYFGYFIGLCVQKPRQCWQILAVGYLSASILHALWNVAGYFSSFLLAIVGILSYACLAAAILKARAISTTRERNFATRLRPRDDR